VSDADGAFVLPVLQGEESMVSASAAGYYALQRRISADQAQQHLDVTLARAPALTTTTGKVQDATGGEVAGAVVAAYGTKGELLATAMTDGNGRFALELKPGLVELSARAFAYATAQRSIEAPASDVVLVAAPGGSIRGLVIDEATRAPVPDVALTLRTVIGLNVPTGSARADESGEFEIGDLSAGAYELSVSGAPWGGVPQPVALGVGETIEDLVLLARSAGSLEGSVSVGGQACPEGRVLLQGPSSLDGSAGPDGKLRIEGVLPGQYHLVVRCGHAPPLEEDREIGAGVIRASWDLDPGLTVDGVALRANGAPMPGVSIIASPRIASGERSWGVSEYKAGSSGEFSCTGLLEGEYDFWIYGGRGQPLSAVVHAELTREAHSQIQLRAEPAATLRVGWAEGAALPDELTVLARKDADSVPYEAARAGRIFTFEALPLGAYDVFAGQSDPAPRAKKAQLTKDGEVVDFTFVPSATEAVAGRLVDEQGVGLDDTWVTLRSRGGIVRGQLEQGSSVLTSADGAFSFTSLIPGEYELQAASSRGASALMNVKSGSSSVLLELRSQIPPGGQASNDRR
jgi:hypothetical protein